MQPELEPEKSKSSGKTKYQQLVEVYDQVVETLEQLKQPEVSSSEADSLRKELAAKSEELQQLVEPVKNSLKAQTQMLFEAEYVICCAEFTQLQANLQPDLKSGLLEKVRQLRKEVETLGLDDLVRSLKDLTSDLAVLGGPVIEIDDLPGEVLVEILSYLDPASVKNASLVNR